jgi:hypothetical protein
MDHIQYTFAESKFEMKSLEPYIDQSIYIYTILSIELMFCIVWQLQYKTSTLNRSFGLIGIQPHEKYKENFDVSSEGRASGSRKLVTLARNVDSKFSYFSFSCIPINSQFSYYCHYTYTGTDHSETSIS